MNQSDQSGTLKVVVQVEDTGYGNALPSDFIIKIHNIKDVSNLPNPDFFTGSKEGTNVSLQKGTYRIDASASTPRIVGAWYDTKFSGDCIPTGNYQAQVDVEFNETRTCIITKVYSES